MKLEKSEIQKIIDKKAEQYDLDWTWMSAIVSTESGWNPYAMRYEPSYAWFYKTEECAKLAKVTLATEIATQKMSWGLAQIMGALAREQGHHGALSELTIPEINIDQLALRLKYLRGLTSESDAVFAAYNGGPGALKKIDGAYVNQKYVDTVNSFREKLLA
jgi:soluble lytic murein transglycosylase-like protein